MTTTKGGGFLSFNKFLHNWKCKTFEDCFKSLDSTYKALKKLYKPDSSIPLENQMTFCYNSLSDDIVDIAINHLTNNVINAKVSRQRDKEKIKKYNELTSNLSTLFLEMLDSEVLKKYSIKQVDKMQLISKFIDKLI